MTTGVMKVLICDDNESDRLMIRYALRKDDPLTDVVDAGDCEEARQKLAGRDVIIIDQRMLGTRGVDCIREIRGDGFRGALVMLTGYLEEKVVAEAVFNGADNFIVKSALLEGLVPGIKRALELRAESMQTTADAEYKKRILDEIIHRLDKTLRDQGGDKDGSGQ